MQLSIIFNFNPRGLKEFNMKFFNAFILAAIVLLSCSKEDSTFADKPLSIDELHQALPDGIKESSYAVYKDEIGNEVRLEILYDESIADKTTQTGSYQSENVYINLGGIVNEKVFRMRIYGVAGKQKSDKLSVLSYELMPYSNPSGKTTGVYVFFKNSKLTRDRYSETVDLFGETYNDVLSYDQRVESYSKLFVTKEHGILAFSDLNNDLWVFDRFE